MVLFAVADAMPERYRLGVLLGGVMAMRSGEVRALQRRDFNLAGDVPAVKVEAAVGIPYITNLEIAAGLTSLNDPSNRPLPLQYAATLGSLSYGLTPLELADGAATIADLGVHHDPTPVDHIIDRSSGKTIFTLKPDASARQVVPENVAFIINEITSNDNNRAMDFGRNGDLTIPNLRVSAKTGYGPVLPRQLDGGLDPGSGQHGVGGQSHQILPQGV